MFPTLFSYFQANFVSELCFQVDIYQSIWYYWVIFGWDWRFQIQEYSGYLHGKHLVMFLPASGLINHSIEFDAKQSHAAKHHKIHHEHRHRFGISLRLSRFIKSRLISHFMFRANHKLKTIIYSLIRFKKIIY